MQIVINLAPVSLSNKKVNLYTCQRLTFLKKNATENAYKSISEPLDFKIFLRGACPQTPLAARAFGDRNLLRLVLTSGYGPDLSLVLKYRVELLTTVHCKPPLYKQGPRRQLQSVLSINISIGSMIKLTEKMLFDYVDYVRFRNSIDG